MLQSKKIGVLLLFILVIFSSLSIGFIFGEPWEPPVPATLWNDNFNVSPEENDWTVDTSGNGILRNDSDVYYSSPYSLYVKSYGSSRAFAVPSKYKMVSPNSNGSLCSIDYSRNYKVELYFFLPTTNNHWIHVFKNRHIITVIDYGTELKARWGYTNYLITNLNTSTWYRITWRVEVFTQKYFVDVFNVKLGKNITVNYECNFHGEPFGREPFVIGDTETGSANYGEAYWDNISFIFVSKPIKNVVFRLLAVEGFAHIGGEIPIDLPNITDYNTTNIINNYTEYNCTDVPMKSAQYLIYALTAKNPVTNWPYFLNWNNYTWAGTTYTSYIHLLSYSDLLPGFSRYYRGVSNRTNVINEIQNFLGKNDPNAYTIRIFYYAGHGGRQVVIIPRPPLSPPLIFSSYWLELGTINSSQRLYAWELNQTLLSGALAKCSSTLVILDCCYSGGFIPYLKRNGRCILTSSKSNEKSWSWAWNPKPGSPLVPPCYWNWFTGTAGPGWPPVPPACPIPPRPQPPPVKTWPNTGLIGALFNKGVDTDFDGWKTASEVFAFAQSTTKTYASCLGKAQNPQSIYGVANGELPIVMYSSYKIEWQYIPGLGFVQKVIETKFHPNPPRLKPPPPHLPRKSWNGFRCGPSRTGYSFDPPEPHGELLWNISLYSPIRSSVAIVNGIAVVGTENGTLFAIDTRNGEILWNFTANGPIFSSPYIANGTIFVGTSNPLSGSTFYALELSTGIIMWNHTFPPDHTIISSPAVVNGKVFVGISNYTLPLPQNRIFAFNQTTGEPIWNFTTETPLWSSPALANGSLFFAEYGAFGTVPARVWALNETNGEPIWQTEIPNSLIVSTPAVADNLVFIGTTGTAPGVMALNKENGYIEWFQPTMGNISSSPAVDSDKQLIIIGDESGFVYCLNETNGEIIWTEQLSPLPINMSSPAISNNGLVFIGSTDRNFYCLNETNGEIIWNYTTSGEIISSPALVEDHVLIGSTNGTLYCFGPPFPTYDLVALNLTVSPKTPYYSSLVTITYTIKNNGSKTETFNVTLYYHYYEKEIWTPPLYLDPQIIYTTSITLAPGENLTLTYQWRPPRHRVNIILEIEKLEYEIDDTNNFYIFKDLTPIRKGGGGAGKHALLR